MDQDQMRGETRFFPAEPGRVIAFVEVGDPRGLPVIYAHSGPGSRLQAAAFHRAAREQGVCLIAADRPGFGQSDFHPGRNLKDYARDMAALADHLGIGRFAHLGWSGGGPPSLAAARYIPERLTACLILAGLPGLKFPDDLDLMSQADRVAVQSLQTSPIFFRGFFKLMAATEKYAPKTYLDSFLSAASADDQRILASAGARARFMADQAEAFLQGSRGVAWDAEIEYASLGFEPEEIEFPVEVWHGAEDTLINPVLQERYVARLPRGALRILPERGHLFPLEMAGDILARLRELAEGGAAGD